jgi:hypothetical protein
MSVLSLGVVLLTGCGENGVTNDWAGTIEQLPNGATRVTNPPIGLWASGNVWTLDPAVVVGGTDGDGPAAFGSI